MPIVHHRKASALSYPLWFATRALLKPTLALWPLNRPGMAGLFLIDRLFAGAPEPRHVGRERMELAGRPTEVVMPSGPSRRDADTAILYLHGGGFLSCGANTHGRMVTELSRFADSPVFLPNYRMVPKHSIGPGAR